MASDKVTIDMKYVLPPLRAAIENSRGNSMNKRKTWQFHVIAPDVQINFTEIRKDLSSSYPIALVEHKGEKEWQGWVLIHDSIYSKLAILAEEDEYYSDDWDSLATVGMNIYVEDPSEFAYWTSVVKLVKNAQWPDKVKNKGTVKVTLPNIGDK